VSILPHEMTVIEPGENPNPTRTLTWKSLDFLRHIKCRTNDDRFPLPLWETWFWSSLGVPLEYRLWLDLLNSVYVTLFIMIRMEIISRHVKLNQLLYRFTIGLFISWVYQSVLWVT
jgi:hypothetical protein